MSNRGFTIVSGGQTGVDRAALDVAMFLDIEHGGWCPRGRLAEDGSIPMCYQLRECDSPEYQMRTEKNVIDSDGTLILFRGRRSGGTELTFRLARRHGRPCLAIDLANEPTASDVHDWLDNENISKLNIAGPRESNCPGITRQSEHFLTEVFRSYKHATETSPLDSKRRQ